MTMSGSSLDDSLPAWRYPPGPNGGQDSSSILCYWRPKLTSMQNDCSGSSRTRDTAYSEHHIPDIQKLGKDLNDAAQAAWPRRHCIRYTSVQVLLLSWADDDLGVSAEIEPLKRLFQERYYFGVEEYKIPNIKPDPAVTRRVLEFLEYDSKKTLLILYYGGHARPALQSNEGPLWVANRDSPFPVIPSGGIQSKFEQAESDVILLLDCCFSAATPITGFQQNGKVMEVMTACGYETIAAEADRHSFTKALSHVLARASKGPPFTIGELHSRVLSRLKCYAPELEVVEGNYVDTADRGLRLEPLVRRTPFYSTLCKTIPPRSIVLAPLRQPHATIALDSERNTTDHSSTDSSEQCGPSENGQSQNLPRKQRRPLEEKESFPQIILAVRLTKSSIHHESWLEWIRNAPLEAEDIHVEGRYSSFSTLLLLRMPVSIWNLLPDNPAYSFVGFVTSENTASDRIPICPCVNLCSRCIKKIRAAKISSVHQHQDQDTDLLPSQDSRTSVNEKRAREADEADSDADTPRSTGSSVTEVEGQAQHPSQSPNYPDALRSQSDTIGEDVRQEFLRPAPQTTTTGIAGSSPLSEGVASSLGALYISREKGKARDFGKVSNRGTPAPLTPELAPDNDPIAHRTRSAQHRKTYTKSNPSEKNDALPPSRSVNKTLAASSRSSNVLKKRKVSPPKTLHRESQSQQFSTPIPNSPGPAHSSSLGSHPKWGPNTCWEWFWFCCQCHSGPVATNGYNETCATWECGHTRCSGCKLEQHKVRKCA